VEAGEIQIRRQNVPECTKSHVKFWKFYGVIPPNPYPLEALHPDLRGKGKKGRNRRKWEREEGETVEV